MLFNFLISITVSKFTKKIPEEVQRLVLEIRKP
jgi:Na+(H+)/acetate symporter ActP